MLARCTSVLVARVLAAVLAGVLASAPAGARAAGPEAAVAGAPAPESAKCRSLRSSLERLESRLRAGYRAAEGEKLRARHRQLREAWGAAGCRWHAPPR